MPDAQKFVVLELNEVPFRVFDYFVARNPNSNIARLFSRSNIFETMSEDEGHLSPWVTWPSLHRGVNDSCHGIYDFGQNLQQVDKDLPPIWQLLAKSGVKVGMFGSLHSYPVPDDLDNYAFYVPDTFAAGPECFPEKLSAFQEFNLAMVDQSGRNVDKSLMLDKALPFLAAAPGLGLRGRTILSLGRQLAREKLAPHLICRRRTSQVEIAFDFFLRPLARTAAARAGFFTNHVASSLHRYWPGTFPGDYPEAIWADGYVERFSSEIDYTMSVADRFIGDLMRFTERHKGYSLLVMSSMGQEAVPDRDQVWAQVMCTDLERFMVRMGVPQGTWEKRRAMAPAYSVALSDGADQRRFVARLKALRIAGQPLVISEQGAVINFQIGHPNLDDGFEISDGDNSYGMEDLGLRNVEIADKSAAFAYHIPQGVMVHYNPGWTSGRSTDRHSISTLDVAPALLHNFGVVPPAYMSKEFRFS